MNEFDSFEQELLEELCTVVEQRVEHRRRQRVRTMRRRFLSVGVAAALAVAVAGVVVNTNRHQESPSPSTTLAAFTLAKAPDGAIVVTIRRLEDASGLQAALKADGVNAKVTFSPKGILPPGAQEKVALADREGRKAILGSGDFPDAWRSCPRPIDPKVSFGESGGDYVISIPTDSVLRSGVLFGLVTSVAGNHAVLAALVTPDGGPRICGGTLIVFRVAH